MLLEFWEFIGKILYCYIACVFKYNKELLIGIISLDGVIISILFPKILEMRDNINKIYCSENVNKYVNDKFYLSMHIIINLIVCLATLTLFDAERYIHIVLQFFTCLHFGICILKTYSFYRKNTEMYMVNNLEKQIKKEINNLIEKNKEDGIEDKIDILRDILINPLHTNEKYFMYNDIKENFHYLSDICKTLSDLKFNKTKYYISNKDKSLFLNLENCFLDIKILNIIFEMYGLFEEKILYKNLKNLQTEIYSLLIYFSSKDNCQEEVKYILNRLYFCMTSDKSLLIIYYHYYTIIFDRFRKEKFNNIYLDLFNDYANKLIKYILNTNDIETFKNIIAFSIGKSSDIYNPEDADENKLKIRKFKDLFLKTASFALYKKNYNALDILFNFHTPKDFTVYWCNKDILPHSLKEVFEWVYNNNIWLEEIEDHHGIKIYYETLKYLLILRALYVNNSINENITIYDLDSIPLSELQILQQFNSEALKLYHSNTSYNEEDLKNIENNIVSIVNNIFENNDMLNIIGIKEPNRIKADFITALKNISELANKREENIIIEAKCSENKIKDIRDEIFNYYTDGYSLLSVFNKYNLILIDYYNNFEKPHVGYNIAIQKEMFIDGYPASFIGITSELARGVQGVEDHMIFEKIEKKSQSSSIDDLENLIDNTKNKDDLVIILNHANIYNLKKLEDKMNIVIKYKYTLSKDEQKKFSKYYKLNNFSGILIYKNVPIPVYSSFMGNKKSQLFLLLKSKECFGNIVEYIYDGDEKQYFDKKTKLFCKLSEINDHKQVQLQLYKKIDVNLSDKFKGFVIPLENP